MKRLWGYQILTETSPTEDNIVACIEKLKLKLAESGKFENDKTLHCGMLTYIIDMGDIVSAHFTYHIFSNRRTFPSIL